MREGEDVPPPIQVDRQRVYDRAYAQCMEETKKDTLGSIFYQMAQKINSLGGSGQTETVDMERLCAHFAAFMQEKAELQTQNNELAASRAQEKNVDLRLNYHISRSKISPPTQFSEYDVMTNIRTAKDCLSIFPRKKYENHEVSGPIAEFLETLRTAQEYCMLSEKEFTKQLLASTTGEAYKHLYTLVENKEPLKNIYFRLCMLYDRTITPEAAREQLSTLKANKGDTLNSLANRILYLAELSVSIVGPGIHRAAYIDNQAVQSLISAMPNPGHLMETPRKLLSQEYRILCASMAAPPTFSQFLLALDLYAEKIDEGLKAYGVPTRTEQSMKVHPTAKPYFGYNRARVNALSLPNRGPRRANISTRGRTRYQGTARINNLNSTQTHSGPSGNNSTSAPYRQYNKYCSLCSGTNHTSSDICFKMKNREGKSVLVSPSQVPCTYCIEKTGKRLFHPRNYCFLEREHKGRSQKGTQRK
jgi:hypothetical protein